jgi:hypothetical protein
MAQTTTGRDPLLAQLIALAFAVTALVTTEIFSGQADSFVLTMACGSAALVVCVWSWLLALRGIRQGAGWKVPSLVIGLAFLQLSVPAVLLWHDLIFNRGREAVYAPLYWIAAPVLFPFLAFAGSAATLETLLVRRLGESSELKMRLPLRRKIALGVCAALLAAFTAFAVPGATFLMAVLVTCEHCPGDWPEVVRIWRPDFLAANVDRLCGKMGGETLRTCHGILVKEHALPTPRVIENLCDEDESLQEASLQRLCMHGGAIVAADDVAAGKLAVSPRMWRWLSEYVAQRGSIEQIEWILHRRPMDDELLRHLIHSKRMNAYLADAESVENPLLFKLLQPEWAPAAAWERLVRCDPAAALAFSEWLIRGEVITSIEVQQLAGDYLAEHEPDDQLRKLLAKNFEPEYVYKNLLRGLGRYRRRSFLPLIEEIGKKQPAEPALAAFAMMETDDKVERRYVELIDGGVEAQRMAARTFKYIADADLRARVAMMLFECKDILARRTAAVQAMRCVDIFELSRKVTSQWIQTMTGVLRDPDVVMRRAAYYSQRYEECSPDIFYFSGHMPKPVPRPEDTANGEWSIWFNGKPAEETSDENNQILEALAGSRTWLKKNESIESVQVTK